MYEKQVIMDMFYDKPLMLLTGYGFGAYFDMKDSLDIWLIESQLFGAEQVHNVHFLHMALLFRFGIIGLALYFCILIFVIRRLLGLRKNTTIENKDQFFISAFGALYIISATAFASTASSTFFVDPLIGFSLACVGFYHNIRHQSKW
jgi:O-antigen ligase